jgi:outer membrane protein OmpA-like peptidoglycan-associated protein
MKKTFCYLPSFLGLVFLMPVLRAQVIVQPVTPVPTETRTVVVEEARPTVQLLDPVVVRRQLSIAPRVVVAPTAPPPVLGTVPVPPPEAIAVVNRPRRVYVAERNVVQVQEREETRELPYVTLPVLFVKETAELLDAESRAALDQMAGVILEIAKTEPNAKFDIEGHTSTDGADDFNLNLSVARAKRVHEELTQRYGVPASVLTAHGYGENHPVYPQGTEAQMQQDRRVLVVRSS